MDATEAAAIVGATTWRPGTRFAFITGTPAALMFGDPDSWYIILYYKGPDSDNPDQTIDLTAPIKLPPPEAFADVESRVFGFKSPGRQRFIEAVKSFVLDFWDRHESAEWFKIDGVRVTDLHPGRAAGLPPAEAARKEREDAVREHEKARSRAADRMFFGPDDYVP